MRVRTKKNKYRRRLHIGELIDDDPLSGLANLSDVWIVFAVALLLALSTYYNLPELAAHKNATLVKNPGKPDMEIIIKKGIKLEKYRMTMEKTRGEGEKLGTCYRLKTGEVVYIPDTTILSD